MKLQRLLSYTRQAVDDYQMILDGDKIAIGLSGGKDSLALLYALANLQRFYPFRFELVAITVDLGFEDFSTTALSSLCKEFHIPYYCVKREIYDIVFHQRKESSPCSLCAKLRKGALNQKALELGCNKIAYAHHKDDFIETALLSLFFEGWFYCFPPVTFLDQTGLSVIRPMMYVSESEVIGFKNKYDLPVVNNPCPQDGFSKREYVKQLLRQLQKEYPGIKQRIFHAIIEGKIIDWPKRMNERMNNERKDLS